jgi:hypothetical protein
LGILPFYIFWILLSVCISSIRYSFLDLQDEYLRKKYTQKYYVWWGKRQEGKAKLMCTAGQTIIFKARKWLQTFIRLIYSDATVSKCRGYVYGVNICCMLLVYRGAVCRY